jgi:hypothetical protein
VIVVLALGGCHVAKSVPVAPVAVVSNGSIIWTRYRIVLPVDVENDAELCVQPTARMVFEQPNLVGPVCGLTVGELRAWLRRQARAD